MRRRGKITILKLMVVICGIIVLGLCVFWLPWVAKYIVEKTPEYSSLRNPGLIGVYITVIPFYIALYQALKLLNLIQGKNAFSELAVESLRRIKQCAIAIIVLYLVGFAFLIFQHVLNLSLTIIGVLIIFTASTVALFAAVLQELLKNALEIKTENDLTV